MEKKEQIQPNPEESWTSAYLVYGRLTGIDKTNKSISLETKVDDEWVEETYSWGDGGIEDLPDIGCLGEDHEVKVLSKQGVVSRIGKDTVHAIVCDH